VNPRHAHWETRVRASFAKQGAMSLVGATLGALSPGACSIVMPFRADLTQQNGFFHAGMTSAIADSSCGYAAMTLFDEASEVLTVEFKINLIAPADGERLVAEGAVVRAGRTLTICTAQVFAERDTRRVACAIMQATMMRVDAR